MKIEEEHSYHRFHSAPGGLSFNFFQEHLKGKVILKYDFFSSVSEYELRWTETLKFSFVVHVVDNDTYKYLLTSQVQDSLDLQSVPCTPKSMEASRFLQTTTFRMLPERLTDLIQLRWLTPGSVVLSLGFPVSSAYCCHFLIIPPILACDWRSGTSYLNRFAIKL